MSHMASTPSREAASTSIDEAVPGLGALADAVTTLRTRDEVMRFLRDLCTLPELEALAHRWQTVLLLDEGVPYVEIAARVPTSTATVTRVAQWLRHGTGRIPDRARADAPARAEAAVTTGFTRAGENGRLTLAVPAKGRMAEPALRLCADAGLSFEVTERSLVVPCANAPVDLLLVRPSDIPEYAQDGVVDVGITGANLVAEADAEVVTLAELGFARCSLEAAVPVDAAQSAIADLDGLRVATAYPVSTRRLLAERGVECELIPVSGSVEATPRLGLADAIVDLVSTGSTMSANGLRPIGTLLTSQAVLVGGRAAVEARREAVEQLELMLSGVVAGRRRRYVMMNAHVDDLPAIRAVLPGMGAPSVLQLADDGEIAVHAAVEVDEIWNLLPVLRQAGATSILVLPIERLVA